MKKILVGVVAFIFIISVTFVSISCKAEVKTVEEITAAEETTAVEASEVTTEESQVVAGEKRFEDYNVWFDLGGVAGDPVTTVILTGARAASEDLGCKLTTYYSQWNPETMVANFKNAIAQNPTGVVIIGIPGQDAFGPVIDEAFSKGIVCTLLAVDLPDIRAKYKAQGMGFAGSELYQAGYDLGKRCIDLFDIKSGDRAMVWGLLAQETRGERGQGSIDALEEVGVTVDFIEITDDINADPALGVPTFVSYYSKYPDVKLIITDHGGMTSTVKAYLEGAGLEPGKVKAAGFDLSPATADAIQSGYLSVVFDQQFYYQAYLCVQQICLTKAYGLGGIYSNTGAGFVDESNIDELLPLIEKGIR